MSEVRTTDFYPNNPVTDAPAVNANYTAVQTGANLINKENIRVEGVDTRNVSGKSMVIDQRKQENGYNLTFPAIPAAGAQYPFYTEASPFGGKVINTPEWPINHDSTGATNTAAGFGTKISFGASGLAIGPGDVVRFRWWINHFSIFTSNGSNAADHSSTLIYSGGRPKGGTNGSGVGEWCALVYPKVDITDNTLTDANFAPLTAISGAALVDPPNETPGIAGAVPCFGGRFDHTTMIPEFIMTAGNAPTSYAIGTYLFNELACQGEYILRSSGNHTLFGSQLFFSGAWRMTADGTFPDPGPALFLEDQDCDPSVLRYGVSGTFGFERAYLQVIVYRNTMV
jgi:hypothetical protein